MPFEAPDPMVQNLVKELNGGFVEQVLPRAMQAAGAGKDHNSCKNDVDRHCKGFNNHLHCLGQHADAISDKCRADVGKSVPFLCGAFIDRFCDLLDKGIMSCLKAHKHQLGGDCKDAYDTTEHVIKQSKSQKAKVSAGSFEEGTWGTNNCPQKFERIRDETTCKEAAGKFGAKFTSAVDNTKYPGGCYASSSTGHFAFNVDEGSKHNAYVPVCQKAAKATARTAVKPAAKTAVKPAAKPAAKTALKTTAKTALLAERSSSAPEQHLPWHTLTMCFAAFIVFAFVCTDWPHKLQSMMLRQRGFEGAPMLKGGIVERKSAHVEL